MSSFSKKGSGEQNPEKTFQEEKSSGTHEVHDDSFMQQDMFDGIDRWLLETNGIYSINDYSSMKNILTATNYIHVLKSLDELLKRDARRKEDGFPKKIRFGKIIKPAKGGKNKVIFIPTVVEERLIHDTRPQNQEQTTGGSGEGEEGEVIGEEPIHSTPKGEGTGAGEGDDGLHEIESTAYDLGKIISAELQLPNLKDKGKKRALNKYIYDLTDKNRGFGQVLDKKATLRKIIETNLALGNIPSVENIDPNNLLVTPRDKVYRVLSKERDYESQAVVFFVRDYSGSMDGKPTELVVSQHLLVYVWLMYQYENNVETRFILHDASAKEVEDFYSYYNTSVAGGTKIVSAYKLINEIVDNENLASDYNIYVFQGTDGEDWDNEGKDALEELKKILTYVNRMGITIAESTYGSANATVVERYIKNSGLLDQKDLLRLDSMKDDSGQDRILEGLKSLLS